MEGRLFTVAVIACNVAEYLPQCLDSILSQTCGDFELLLGVETSKDDTQKIADEYAQKDSRITVSSTPVSGSASRIRNTAMENASGKYIIFVDGDDWIESDSLAKFKSKIDEFGDLDIIPATATVYRQKKDTPLAKAERIYCGKIPDKVYSGCEYLKNVCPINKLRTATWMAAYKTEFLRADKSLRQPDGRRHQDDEWTPRVFCAAKRVAGIDYAFYNYRIREGSITTKLNPKSMFDISKNIISFLDFWQSGKIPTYLQSSFSTWYADYTYRFFNSHSCVSYDREIRHKCFMDSIGNPENFVVFKKMVINASFSKRLLSPLYAIAIRGKVGFAVAEYLFRFVYEPLILKFWRKLSQKIR